MNIFILIGTNSGKSEELGSRDFMFVIERTEETVNKTFRLPVKLVEKLEKISKEQDVTMNSLVRQCCEYALQDMPKEDRNK